MDANNKNQKREEKGKSVCLAISRYISLLASLFHRLAKCLTVHAAIHFTDKKTSNNTINASSRNLWVSGLSSSTRATDLKQIFSKYGKVIGAKVVTNARTPGARCYGYVTMSTSEDATKCIQYLHRTELHGRVISVEKVSFDLSFEDGAQT